jgi:primosomal replication protein N
MNRLVLSAALLERGRTRYTPAGLPALDLSLKHESTVSENGQPRQVFLEMKAVAIGEISVPLLALALGQQACFGGFMAHARNGRGLLFHITSVDVLEASAPAQPPARHCS